MSMVIKGDAVFITNCAVEKNLIYPGSESSIMHIVLPGIPFTACLMVKIIGKYRLHVDPIKVPIKIKHRCIVNLFQK